MLIDHVKLNEYHRLSMWVPSRLKRLRVRFFPGGTHGARWLEMLEIVQRNQEMPKEFLAIMEEGNEFADRVERFMWGFEKERDGLIAVAIETEATAETASCGNPCTDLSGGTPYNTIHENYGPEVASM
jgi:hypothetical protein